MTSEIPDVSVDPQEFSVLDVLYFAMSLHQQNRFDAAEEVYQSLLRQVPNHPDVMHFYGVLRHQRGYPAEGAEWIAKAIELAPDYMDAHNNLGNIQLQTGDFVHAEQSYRRVIELNPDFVAAYGNLGVALTWLERYDEAVAAHLEAITRDPQPSYYHLNLGNTFQKAGHYERAVQAYEDALARREHDPDAFHNLSRTFYLMGRIPDALRIVDRWLAHEPGNPTALHVRAAYSGEAVPSRASDDYVRETFDRFADSFDMVLKHLDYQAPFLVAQALRDIIGERVIDTLLDVGCGTGLCGALVRQQTHWLAGVDLSAGMLERARRRGVYDALNEAELTEFLLQSAGEYDALLCADTLCYFGDLAAPLAAAHGALKSGGRFILTLEKLEDPARDSLLNLHGRYSHGEPYVCRQAVNTGFEVNSVVTADLRLEFGKPVSGLVLSLLKPEAATVPERPPVQP